ncbi:hypothetical protein [Stenotrophomonas phage BUCT603]|nr:hypothetical protein [Stenotrophomonas phage BUCT603]
MCDEPRNDAACTVFFGPDLTPVQYRARQRFLRTLATHYGLILRESTPWITHLYGPRAMVQQAADNWNAVYAPKESHEVVDTDD